MLDKSSAYKEKLNNAVIREMRGYSHQFPTVLENATKPMILGMSGKLIQIIFPQYG